MTDDVSAEMIENLVVRAQLGDKEAYEQIVRRFQDMAFSYAYSILGDHELAEDARQEAFIAAYCNLLTLREPAAFPAWLRTLVHRHSVNIVRGRRELIVPVEETKEIPSNAPGPRRIAEAREQQGYVEEAIKRLPKQEREVIRLFYLKGCSMREIGRRDGIPEKTVKSRLHTARARLRQQLMEKVKGPMTRQRLQADKRPREAAAAEAVKSFATEAQALMRFPTHEELRRAGDLLCAKGRMERLLGHTDDAIATFEAAKDIPNLCADTDFQARVHAEIGLTRVQTSDYSRARKALEMAQGLLRRTRERSSLTASVLNGLGLCAWGEGDFRKARKLYERTRDVSHQAGCDVLEAEARNNLALLDWKRGVPDKALEGFRFCLRRWKKIGDPYWAPLTEMHIGIIEESQGRPAQAKRRYDQAVQAAEKAGFIQLQGALQSNLANLALTRHRWAAALRHSQAAAELAKQAADKRSQAIAFENEAMAHLGRGQAAPARRAIRDAEQIAKTIGDQERLFSLQLTKAEEFLGRKHHREAAKILTGIDTKKTEYTAELPRIYRLLALTEYLAGDAKAARAAARQGLRESKQQGNAPETERLQQILEKAVHEA